ncbi:MAG: hypothetical protein AB8H86_10340 [Polyangiales bacterium]
MLKQLFGLLRRPEPARTLIRDLRAGEFFSVEGLAVAIGEPIVAPLSGRPCASLSVFYNSEFAGQRGGWPKFSSKKFVSRQAFYLRDESGVVRVERSDKAYLVGLPFPEAPARDEERARRWDSFCASFDSETAEEERLVGELKRSIGKQYLDGWEVAIPEGAHVRVEGVAQATATPAPTGKAAGYREAPTLFALVGEASRTMRITQLGSAVA